MRPLPYHAFGNLAIAKLAAKNLKVFSFSHLNAKHRFLGQLFHNDQFVRSCRQYLKEIGAGIGIATENLKDFRRFHFPENLADFQQGYGGNRSRQIKDMVGFLFQNSSIH